MKRARAREPFAPLSLSLVFFIEYSVLVIRFILTKVSFEFCYILDVDRRMYPVFSKRSYLSNRILQEITFPHGPKKKMITYLTNRRKLFFLQETCIFLSSLRDF